MDEEADHWNVSLKFPVIKKETLCRYNLALVHHWTVSSSAYSKSGILQKTTFVTDLFKANKYGSHQ